MLNIDQPVMRYATFSPELIAALAGLFDEHDLLDTRTDLDVQEDKARSLNAGYRRLSSWEHLLAGLPLDDHQKPCMGLTREAQIMRESYTQDADGRFILHDNGDHYTFTQADRRYVAEVTSYGGQTM